MRGAEMEIDSPARPVIVKVLRPFIVGAPHMDPPRTAIEGEFVTVERWLAADLVFRGLAELS